MLTGGMVVLSAIAAIPQQLPMQLPTKLKAAARPQKGRGALQDRVRPS